MRRWVARALVLVVVALAAVVPAAAQDGAPNAKQREARELAARLERARPGSAEARRLQGELDGLYDRRRDFKELIERGDYYSLGRKLEERVAVERADAALASYVRGTIDYLKYGSDAAPGERIVLLRGAAHDRPYLTPGGGTYFLPNTIRYQRSAWDDRLHRINAFFGDSRDNGGTEGAWSFERVLNDHTRREDISKRSVLVSGSVVPVKRFGPPFYKLRVDPRRAIFNWRSPPLFAYQKEVDLLFFALPEEVVGRFETLEEALADPEVRASPFKDLDYYKDWKRVEENIRAGRDPLAGVRRGRRTASNPAAAGLNADDTLASYNVGRFATDEDLARFTEKVRRRGGSVEYVAADDPRWAPEVEARTYVDSAGVTRVLLPAGRPVRYYALLDELTHVIQIDFMNQDLGPAAVRGLFDRVRSGDPEALDTVTRWEIRAKRNILMTMDRADPNRDHVLREIERYESLLGPAPRPTPGVVETLRDRVASSAGRGRAAPPAAGEARGDPPEALRRAEEARRRAEEARRRAVERDRRLRRGRP